MSDTSIYHSAQYNRLIYLLLWVLTFIAVILADYDAIFVIAVIKWESSTYDATEVQTDSRKTGHFNKNMQTPKTYQSLLNEFPLILYFIGKIKSFSV